jgi:hypothetical protein
MVDVQINTLLKEVMPELAKQGIRLMDYADLDHNQKSKVTTRVPCSPKLWHNA